jgi:hypothetical protein
MAMNPGEVVCRSNFNVVFAEAWQNSMTAKNIFASFKTTGVYPFNRSAILLPGETTEDLQPSKHSLVKFLPMLSPLPSQRKFGTVRHCLDMESHSGQISQRDFSLQSEFSPQLPAQQIPVKPQSARYADQEDGEHLSKEDLFQKRLEEGWDLDIYAKCNRWLQYQPQHKSDQVEGILRRKNPTVESQDRILSKMSLSYNPVNPPRTTTVLFFSARVLYWHQLVVARERKWKVINLLTSYVVVHG